MSVLGPEVERFGELVSEARRVLFFTGAGISTGSGIPDYRGPQGVWKSRAPVYWDDFMSSRDSRVEYWEQKLDSWPGIRDARPNPAHRAIVRLEAQGRVAAVVTQNIDGLHAKAGTAASRLVELHGTMGAVECQVCGERSDPEPHFAAFASSREPPACSCGGPLKPATISFGQALRESEIDRAVTAARSCDLVVALGSTLSVSPANSIPLLALREGAPYVIVNRGATEHDALSGVALRIEGDVSEALPPAVDIALRDAAD